MKTLGNILWLILTGFWTAVGWAMIGILWCVTIIGIPFGIQALKMARITLWPFGSNVKTNFEKHPIANVIWMIFGGIELAIGYFLCAVLWCITIIGIPFGKQCFKMAKIAIVPFGATIS